LKTKRRIIAGLLVVAGALLMFAAPEDMPAGAIVMGLGVLLEIAGIALERLRG
jgi:hypothetical protein